MSRTARTTVIFDFGGVVTSSPFEAFNRLEASRRLPRNTIRQINATNPDDNAWARFERAEMTAGEFDEAFAAEARALGHEVRGAEVIACLAGDLRPAMVNAIDWLNGHGYLTGCITNNVPAGQGAGMAGTAERAAAMADVLARFKVVIESSKVGIRKPDPAIYRMACDALGVEPDACVYLDDLGINCKPAAQMGMIAIKVDGDAQARAALAAALDLVPAPF